MAKKFKNLAAARARAGLAFKRQLLRQQRQPGPEFDTSVDRGSVDATTHDAGFVSATADCVGF